MKLQISITLDPDLIEEIEEKRGLVSRSQFIEYLLAGTLREAEKRVGGEMGYA